MTDMTWAALVPELTCASVLASKRFYCDLLGFEVRYERPENGFVYLCLGAAQIMLEEEHAGAWTVGSLDRPLGRGINFQIEVDALQPIHQRLLSSSVALFREPSEVWYRQDEIEHGQIEMLVQDPDGYLLRLTELLGPRPVSGL
jgi:catechol 2,3-dioxygenase-like lactoylglutathione lyase family enzyme